METRFLVEEALKDSAIVVAQIVKEYCEEKGYSPLSAEEEAEVARIIRNIKIRG